MKIASLDLFLLTSILIGRDEVGELFTYLILTL